MNVHHLELFYHVARCEGVSQAARALDKEQPTLSRQIGELEDYLRVRLFHRRPFKLTEPGEVLFGGIAEFFQELPKLEQQVRGGDTIRIGASPIVLSAHLPAVEKEVRKRFPRLHLVLREGTQPQLAQWLERGEIDLAITLLPRDLSQKVFATELLRLPLVLLVPKASRWTATDQLLRQADISESLICLTPDDLVCREFQQGLKGLDVEWRPQIEVGSLSLVESYVLEGYGVGLSLRIPGTRFAPGVRALELPGFPPLPLGLLWRDNEDRLARAFREAVEARARRIASRA